MNAALEWLLTTRASIDSHCRELTLSAKLTLWMNEAQTTEAIKETEMSHGTMIKEVDVCHATMMKEADVCHTAAIKEAEVCCMTNVCVLQQTHWEGMMALEHETTAEEGQD